MDRRGLPGLGLGLRGLLPPRYGRAL
ncbi:hypothetical protein GA0115246_102661, partial [Streptomyces sp. SolWspMP-sol7th]